MSILYRWLAMLGVALAFGAVCYFKGWSVGHAAYTALDTRVKIVTKIVDTANTETAAENKRLEAALSTALHKAQPKQQQFLQEVQTYEPKVIVADHSCDWPDALVLRYNDAASGIFLPSDKTELPSSSLLHEGWDSGVTERSSRSGDGGVL